MISLAYGQIMWYYLTRKNHPPKNTHNTRCVGIYCGIPLCFHQFLSVWLEILVNSIDWHFPFLSQMAQRLLARRIWTHAANDLCFLPVSTATTASSCFSTSLQSTTSSVSFRSASRTLPNSLPHIFYRNVSFNVQDHEDFTERVINSQLPVLIDFHAKWVVQGGMIIDDSLVSVHKGSQLSRSS